MKWFSPYTVRPMRICNLCKEEKPLSSEYYHADSKGVAKFSARCKPCRNASKKAKFSDHPFLSELGKMSVHVEQKPKSKDLEENVGIEMPQDQSENIKLPRVQIQEPDAVAVPKNDTVSHYESTIRPMIDKIASDLSPKKIPITQETILDAINEKYGATYTITVHSDRTCHINIMQDGWKNTKKFRTPEELLECVL